MDDAEPESNPAPSDINEGIEDFGNDLSDPDPESEVAMPPMKRPKNLKTMKKGTETYRGATQQVKSRVQISSVVKLFVKKIHPSHVSEIFEKNKTVLNICQMFYSMFENCHSNFLKRPIHGKCRQVHPAQERDS